MIISYDKALVAGGDIEILIRYVDAEPLSVIFKPPSDGV